MKIEDFKRQLRSDLEEICSESNWKVDNHKQRGMAFENWFFNLFCERYPAAENDREQAIIRVDDFNIDVAFESKETQEIYLIQCKHEKLAASDPIDENEVISFFKTYELLKDPEFTRGRKNSPKIQNICTEFPYWAKVGFTVNMIFVSTGKTHGKIESLIEKFTKDNQKDNVTFAVWDLQALKNEYVSIKSVDEDYPEDVTLKIGESSYMLLEGKLRNITFAIKGTALQELTSQHKERLFNWNIRRFLGKKGQINLGMSKTLQAEPENFYYYNNGISALCELFDFDGRTRTLRIKKLQVVNGAQTMGALRYSEPSKASGALVLVKLTEIKHAAREKGIAASLIRTNNTQNTLRIPDFRSNDPIQLWIEQKFKDTKPKGELGKIVYGRKRPYPRSSGSQSVLKLQDLGKIRYAWFHDPRMPIADPSRLFQLKDESGLYDETFGVDGELANIWTEEQFKETLLAIHAYNKIEQQLKNIQNERENLKQISRLKYYGLHLFKLYVDQSGEDVSRDDLYLFGGKFDEFFKRASAIILSTLEAAYQDILSREEGTAFSLPRDAKVWELVKKKFSETLRLLERLNK